MTSRTPSSSYSENDVSINLGSTQHRHLLCLLNPQSDMCLFLIQYLKNRILFNYHSNSTESLLGKCRQSGQRPKCVITCFLLFLFFFFEHMKQNHLSVKNILASLTRPKKKQTSASMNISVQLILIVILILNLMTAAARHVAVKQLRLMYKGLLDFLFV